MWGGPGRARPQGSIVRSKTYPTFQEAILRGSNLWPLSQSYAKALIQILKKEVENEMTKHHYKSTTTVGIGIPPY